MLNEKLSLKQKNIIGNINTIREKGEYISESHKLLTLVNISLADTFPIPWTF